MKTGLPSGGMLSGRPESTAAQRRGQSLNCTCPRPCASHLEKLLERTETLTIFSASTQFFTSWRGSSVLEGEGERVVPKRFLALKWLLGVRSEAGSFSEEVRKL